MKKHYFAAAVTAAVILTSGAVAADAKTVTTRTIVTQMDLPRGEAVYFDTLDINRDGILSMGEVGRRLFYIFDTDGNEVIDNLEFERNAVLTLIPMEKKTVELVDLDDDGVADLSSYDYDSFVANSRLSRFDQNYDGLSARDFIETGFFTLDSDDNKTIDLEEWERAYINEVAFIHDIPEQYNR